MTAMQKQAWYNLTVIVLTLLVVFCLYPFLHGRAWGALGLLGLLGFGVIFLRRKSGEVLADERDALISLRAMLAAFGVVGMIYLALTLLTPLHYGSDGVVPVPVVQAVLAGGCVLFVAIHSLVMLIQYGRGG
jgi:hypothetical protein